MLRLAVNIANTHNANIPNPINQNTKRPPRTQIYELGQRVNDRLFHQRGNDGRTIKYESSGIIRLHNYVPNQNEIPHSIRVPRGDAVLFLKSQKRAMQSMGTRGTKLQQQNNEALFFSANTTTS